MLISRTLVKYVLTAALRDRLVLTLFMMILAGAGMSSFLGQTGMTEKNAFSIVFGSAGLRFLSVLGVVLFCSFYVRRSFETKEVEFLLARPLSRQQFIISHAAAFYVMCLCLTALVTVAILFLGRSDTAGLVLWSGSLAVETMIMASVSLFFAMVLSSASGSALASIGFYALSRVVGTLLVIASVPSGSFVFEVINNLMNVISLIIPRLDLMCQSSWLVYGVDGSSGLSYLNGAGSYAHGVIEALGVSGFIVVQGLVFVCLVLGAAIFDFLRHEF